MQTYKGKGHCFYMRYNLELWTDQIFQAWPCTGPHSCNFGLARPEREIKISSRVRLGQKQNTKFWPKSARLFFFSNLGPDRLGLSDFKTGPFSCSRIINEFFCWWYIFLQFINTTDLVLTSFHYSSICIFHKKNSVL